MYHGFICECFKTHETISHIVFRYIFICNTSDMHRNGGYPSLGKEGRNGREIECTEEFHYVFYFFLKPI